MGNYKPNSTINQTSDWYDQVKAFCQRIGLSRNILIRDAVNLYMKDYENSKREVA